MDVLQYILQSFSGNENLKKFAPVLELALKNGFDFKKIMQNLDVNAILPILSAFFNQPAATAAPAAAASQPLSAISTVADKDIVYCLNRYLSGGAV